MSGSETDKAPEAITQLLPCPFCGESPLEDRIEPHEHSTALMGIIPIPYSYPGSWSVECVKCECRIFSHASRDEAVKRWNTRAPTLQSSLERTERELREAREALEALKKHVRHSQTCARPSGAKADPAVEYTNKCTCGASAALSNPSNPEKGES
jgi:hypothetical protein